MDQSPAFLSQSAGTQPGCPPAVHATCGSLHHLSLLDTGRTLDPSMASPHPEVSQPLCVGGTFSFRTPMSVTPEVTASFCCVTFCVSLISFRLLPSSPQSLRLPVSPNFLKQPGPTAPEAYSASTPWLPSVLCGLFLLLVAPSFLDCSF